MNKMKKLYIGCALINLPSDKRDVLLRNISDLKIKLANSFEVLEFLWVKVSDPSKTTPKDVYETDIINCVGNADCMLAICDYPSLGLGYEMATAIEKHGIPVLAVAHKDSFVSKLIIGINHKDFEFYLYDSFDDVYNKVINKLK